MGNKHTGYPQLVAVAVMELWGGRECLLKIKISLIHGGRGGGFGKLPNYGVDDNDPYVNSWIRHWVSLYDRANGEAKKHMNKIVCTKSLFQLSV